MITIKDIKLLNEKKAIKTFDGLVLKETLMNITDDDGEIYGEITRGLPTGTSFYIEMNDKQIVSFNVARILEYIVNNIDEVIEEII